MHQRHDVQKFIYKYTCLAKNVSYVHEFLVSFFLRTLQAVNRVDYIPVEHIKLISYDYLLRFTLTKVGGCWIVASRNSCMYHLQITIAQK